MYANLLVLLTLLASSARALTCPQGAGTDTAGPSTLQAYDPVTGTVTPLFIYLYGADAPTGFSIITPSFYSSYIYLTISGGKIEVQADNSYFRPTYGIGNCNGEARILQPDAGPFPTFATNYGYGLSGAPAIYCSVPSNTGLPILSSEGHTDKFALCASRFVHYVYLTAVVYDPVSSATIASGQHYDGSSCVPVLLQLVPYQG